VAGSDTETRLPIGVVALPTLVTEARRTKLPMMLRK